MALSADANYTRHGGAKSEGEFGYAPSAGVVIYRHALLGMTVGGTVQPIQTAGSVVFAGLADRASGTVGQPVVQQFVIPSKGTYGIVVPTVTAANIGTYLNANVYATDDSTLTLTAGSNLLIGTLVGLDTATGLTYVKLLGS
jgi:hypothetical protein